MYTVLELTNEVTAHIFPPVPAEPTLVACLSTMRNVEPNMFAAEILVSHPTEKFSTPYLYVSNRDDSSPKNDVISVFSLANPQKPERLAEVRSGLRHLRGMAFGGPDDRWLIAGGVHGGGVKVFERVDGGKGLKEIASVELEAPTSFLWM